MLKKAQKNVQSYLKPPWIGKNLFKKSFPVMAIKNRVRKNRRKTEVVMFEVVQQEEQGLFKKSL